MKQFIVYSALVFSALVAVNASAAQQLTRQQAKEMNLTLIGTVTTTTTNAPMDARADLSQKADEKGGKYYVIIAADERGRTLATAEVYK